MQHGRNLALSHRFLIRHPLRIHPVRLRVSFLANHHLMHGERQPMMIRAADVDGAIVIDIGDQAAFGLRREALLCDCE